MIGMARTRVRSRLALWACAVGLGLALTTTHGASGSGDSKVADPVKQGYSSLSPEMASLFTWLDGLAMEELLVGRLEDMADHWGLNGALGGKFVLDARICDMAADALHSLFPGRYDFDIFAPLATRERQRVECLNVWRKEHPASP